MVRFRPRPPNPKTPSPAGRFALWLHRLSAVRSSIHIVDVDRTETWTRYRAGLCDSCVANCCTMPLEVRLPDLVRLGVVDPFEVEHEAPKQIAKRLEKAGLIDHFNFKREVFTIARRASGDCHFLDAKTRRCTVYEQRPDTCRKHPLVSPRPNHCPYGAKRTAGSGPLHER